MSDQSDPGSGINHAPGLFRRLGAMLYDSLLVAGLMLTAIAPVIIILGIIFGLDRVDAASLRTNPLFIVYLLCIPLLFFVCFWKLAGQTLGMRTWRIRIVDNHGATVGWGRAVARYFAAVISWAGFGLGFLWILVDPEKRAWHDLLSGTRLILVAKDQ
ncbi:MAG: RDD family protein [Gammaproteobacteria bacterium]|nr:RDD family protein [Gammaproteobacteria bacterium]